MNTYLNQSPPLQAASEWNVRAACRPEAGKVLRDLVVYSSMGHERVLVSSPTNHIVQVALKDAGAVHWALLQIQPLWRRERERRRHACNVIPPRRSCRYK